MISEWPGIGAQRFRDEYFRSLPLARACSVRGARTLLDWDVLGIVLAASDPADILVVSRGEMLPLPVPRTVATVREYMNAGIGLCVRHGERHHPGLAAIAQSFEDQVGEAHVQLFVTPGGSHGFGWHYDDEDVFIVQTCGVKDYYFRPNTVAADRPAHPDVFGVYSAERSPLYTAHLVADDFLYLPARWWHMARCLSDSLSISVGVIPR